MLRLRPLAVARLAALASALGLLVPAVARGQQPTTEADSARIRAVADSIALARHSLATPAGPGLRPPVWRDTTTFRLGLAWSLPPLGRFSPQDEPVDAVVAARARLLEQTTRARVQSLWGQTAVAGFSVASAEATAAIGATTALELEERDRLTRAERTAARRRAAADSTRAAGGRVPGDSSASGFPGADILGGYADLNLELNARLETKLERNKNESCSTSLLFVTGPTAAPRSSPTSTSSSTSGPAASSPIACT